MASITELVALFNNGELGKLLAREFNGERGHVHPNEDSDLIIVFESNEDTPSVDEINEVVTRHYSQLGYRVILDGYGAKNVIGCSFRSDDSDEYCVCVTISTSYPFNGKRSAMRISSIIS